MICARQMSLGTRVFWLGAQRCLERPYKEYLYISEVEPRVLVTKPCYQLTLSKPRYHRDHHQYSLDFAT